MLSNLRRGAFASVTLLVLTLVVPAHVRAGAAGNTERAGREEPLPWPRDAPDPSGDTAPPEAAPAPDPAATEPGPVDPPAAEPAPAEPQPDPPWDPPPQPPPQPTPPPVAVPPPDSLQLGTPADAPPRRPRPRGVGMMTTGFVIFGVTYLATAITGAVLIDGAGSDFSGGQSSYERAAQEAVGRRLLAPVIGPFLAIDPAQTASAAVGLSLVGGLQVASLAIGAGGIARYVQSKRQIQAGYASIPGGGMMRLGFQF